MIARPTCDDVDALVNLIEGGFVTPVVDRTYALADTAEVLRYLESCRARGKVIVTVCSAERRNASKRTVLRIDLRTDGTWSEGADSVHPTISRRQEDAKAIQERKRKAR